MNKKNQNKYGTFFICGEADGDADLLNFVESCHPEFYKQRIEGNDEGYQLVVNVSVELINVDDDM